MTAGNYVRPYSVRSGSGSPRAGAWCAVCGVWCAVCGVWCSVRGAWCAVCGAGQDHLSCSPRVPLPLGPLSISHVIPSRLFQTLNSQRWNCNVLGRSRKVTAGNYVRHYSVRSGSGSPRAGAWCAVCGARCAVCGARCVVRGARVWCWSGPSQLWSSWPSTAGPSINFARNSLATISNFEFAALELQRFGR